MSDRSGRRNGLPSEDAIQAWATALQEDSNLVAHCWKWKRWTPAAIERLSIGIHNDRFTIPIRDGDGTLVNLIRYAPDAIRSNGQPKSLAVKNAKRDLFPAPETIEGDEVWLWEGESDAITATALGLPAVGVPGTQGWKKAWAKRFEDRAVFILLDCDDKARIAAEKIAADLWPYAESVRIVPLDPNRDDGYDLGDFVMDAETPDELHQAKVLLYDLALGTAEFVPEAEAWPPLVFAPAPPGFPVDALPPDVGEWVNATAEATQTPHDLAASTALGVLSACVTGHVRTKVKHGWEEEACLYAVCALESGERKSAVVRAGVAPLRELERDWITEATPRVAEAKTRREAIEGRRKKLITDASRTDNSVEREAWTNEAAKLAAQLTEEAEPHVPRLLADDATPEALGGLLARHGRIAIIAAESAFLDNLGGRYSEGRSNLHLVCQAYSGEPTTIDRRGREPEALDRPLLTMVLCVQPHVLAALVGDQTARNQGFVARCLLARLGRCSDAGRSTLHPVPETTTQKWETLVRRLAQPPKTSDRTDTTGVLSVVQGFWASQRTRRPCWRACASRMSRAYGTAATCARSQTGLQNTPDALSGSRRCCTLPPTRQAT